MSQPALVEITSSSRYAGEVLGQDPADVALGRPVRRAVVVGQVEVADPEVEGPAHDRSLRLDRLVVAEVVPEPQRHGGEQEPAAPAAAVGLDVVAVVGGGVGHARDPTGASPPTSPAAQACSTSTRTSQGPRSRRSTTAASSVSRSVSGVRQRRPARDPSSSCAARGSGARRGSSPSWTVTESGSPAQRASGASQRARSAPKAGSGHGPDRGDPALRRGSWLTTAGNRPKCGCS